MPYRGGVLSLRDGPTFMNRSLDLGARYRDVGLSGRGKAEWASLAVGGLVLATAAGVELVLEPQNWGWVMMGALVLAPLGAWVFMSLGSRVLRAEVHERGFVLGSLRRRKIARRSTIASVMWTEQSNGLFLCEVHFRDGDAMVIDGSLAAGRSLGWVLYAWWRDGEEIARLLQAVRDWES